jgi:hypothetical protein
MRSVVSDAWIIWRVVQEEEFPRGTARAWIEVRRSALVSGVAVESVWTLSESPPKKLRCLRWVERSGSTYPAVSTGVKARCVRFNAL